MSSTPSTTEKPKRQHRSLEEARDLVAAWRSSGIGKEAWCRERGLRRSMLSSCLYRTEAAEAQPSSAATFLAISPPRSLRPAAVEPPATSPSVSIELPCGLRVTGLDAASAAIVVRLLREAGP